MYTGILLALLVGAVVIVGINAFSLYLFIRLKSLILETAHEVEDFMGDNVAHMCAQYLFADMMRSRFYNGSNIRVIGDPESNPTISAVRESAQFDRLYYLAGYVRELPVNFTPHLV